MLSVKFLISRKYKFMVIKVPAQDYVFIEYKTVKPFKEGQKEKLLLIVDDPITNERLDIVVENFEIKMEKYKTYKISLQLETFKIGVNSYLKLTRI